MGKESEKHRLIYRNGMGITWDGGLYNIHHINGDHTDNSLDNLILLPETLHIRLHAIMRRARLDWDMNIREFVLDAYMRGFDGDYVGNMEWFSIYTQIIRELAFWGKMKSLRYRSEITGAMLPLEGIKEYAKF